MQRPGDADLQGQLARDHADALRAHQEEGVALQHRLVLVEPLLDEVDGLAHWLAQPAGMS